MLWYVIKRPQARQGLRAYGNSGIQGVRENEVTLDCGVISRLSHILSQLALGARGAGSRGHCEGGRGVRRSNISDDHIKIGQQWPLFARQGSFELRRVADRT